MEEVKSNEQLAEERYPVSDDMNMTSRTLARIQREVYLSALNEVADPLREENRQLREHLQELVNASSPIHGQLVFMWRRYTNSYRSMLTKLTSALSSIKERAHITPEE